MKLKVHLVFDGCCEDAMNFYKEILNGELAFLFRKKDNKGLAILDDEREEISHMVIKMPNFDLTGEDVSRESNLKIGNNTKLILSFNNLTECKKIFGLISNDGDITSPLQKTFYSEGIGELTDKYGISWIIMVADNV